MFCAVEEYDDEREDGEEEKEEKSHCRKRRRSTLSQAKKQIYNLMYIRRAPNPLNTVRKTPFPPIIMLDARHSLFKTKGKLLESAQTVHYELDVQLQMTQKSVYLIK